MTHTESTIRRLVLAWAALANILYEKVFTGQTDPKVNALIDTVDALVEELQQEAK